MLALLRLNHCSHAINLNLKRAITTSQLQEYYSILDVNRGSTQREIKDSFLKLSKVYHPDNKQTGSHLKFVKLKEAYDAIKDGTPTVTGSTYSSSSSSQSSQQPPWASNSYEQARYSNDGTYYNEEMNRHAHAYYRYRQRQYDEAKQTHGGFGGPYARSSTAWEDLKRDQAYRRKQQFGGLGMGRSFVNTTIFLSAIAWIFIYSGVLLIWEHNDRIKTSLFNFKPRNHADYVAYEEYLRRKETQNLLKGRLRAEKKAQEEKIKESPQASEMPKVVESKVNHQQLTETIDPVPLKQAGH